VSVDVRSVSAELLPGRSRERGGGAGFEFGSRSGRSLDVDTNERIVVGVDGAEGRPGVTDTVDADDSVRTTGGAGERRRGVPLGDGLRDVTATVGATRFDTKVSSEPFDVIFTRVVLAILGAGLRFRGVGGVGVFSRSSLACSASA
jgi:hypothetical protein